MGRPQRQLDPGDGPLAEFAAGLRDLRDRTGPLTYRRLAARAHYSATTLADAAGGERLPSLAVTLAYVEACGGDRAEWEKRWHAVAAELADDGGNPPAQDGSSGDRDRDGDGDEAEAEAGAGGEPEDDRTGRQAEEDGTDVPYGPGPGPGPRPAGPAEPAARGGRAGAPAAARRRRAALPLALAALAVLVVAGGVAGLPAWRTGPGGGGSTGPGHSAPGAEQAGAHRYFAGDDPVNRRNSRRTSPDSAKLARSLLSAGELQVAAGSAGTPVHRASADTPTYRVKPRRHLWSWGPNPFSGIDYPWDPSWKAPENRGGWSIVVTRDGTSLECWRTAVRRDGAPSCEWGGVSDTRRSSVATSGTPTGSGLSRLAGLITRHDWRSGRIRHALTFSTPFNGPRHVYPAVRSDGRGPDRWAEGQFIWLDRSYDIDADHSLRPYERIVAHALQDYGAFDVGYADTVAFTSEQGAAPPGGKGGAHLSLPDVKFAKYLRVGRVRP